MLEFSSTESCTTSNTSSPLVGFASNDSTCDGNVALMNDFESTSGCSGQGPQGPEGFSAYQIAVFDGFVGTETQWLASLVGAPGPGVPVGGTAGQILAKIDSANYNTQWINNTDLIGLTSVGISLPTGLTVSNSPLVVNGVLNVTYQSGYAIPTTASQTNWDTAYSSRISSLTTTGSSGAATLASNVLNIPTYTLAGLGGQPLSTNLTALTGLTFASTSFVKMTAAGTFALDTNTYLTSAVTSIGLTVPSAFNVTPSTITTSGTFAITGAGMASQYVRGDGTLATLPSGGGGGSSVNYYLNGSVNASVATYKQLSNTAVIGAGTDFTKTGNGLISQFLTDVGNPNRTEIPGGAWNFEMFFSMSSNGGSPAFYVELLKYDGVTFTSIVSSSVVPENITGGTSIDLYLTSLAVPTTPLLVTDRLAIRVYIVNNSGGRTATLHTENSHLCEIITTFSGGVTSLNGLTANTQYFAVGTSGADFGILSVTDTHTFNLPTASAINRGALSSTDWSAFNNKQNTISLTTTGTSGAATLVGSTLNIPNYAPDLSGYVTLAGTQTITGVKTFTGGSLYINSGSISTAGTLYLGDGSITKAPGSGFTLSSLNIVGNSNFSNFIDMVAGTAATPQIKGVGGSTGIYWPNGATGTAIGFAFAGARMFESVGIASGVNYIRVQQAITGSSPALSAQGTDTNINLTIIAKGSGSAIISSTAKIGAATAPNASSVLDIESTTKGFLPPRMTTAQKNAIATPATGLVVFDTDLAKLCVFATTWQTITSI